jgi:hypothetical protein
MKLTTSTLAACALFAAAASLPGTAAATNIIAKANISQDVESSETGLAVFPGAKRMVNKDEAEINGAKIDFAIGRYGLKVTVAKLISNATPDEIATFYKKDLARYGEVVDCSDAKGSVIASAAPTSAPAHESDAASADHDDSKNEATSDRISCETRVYKKRHRKGETAHDAQKTSKQLNFRVGSKMNQRIVAIKPLADGFTEFALVHVNLRLPTWLTENSNANVSVSP